LVGSVLLLSSCASQQNLEQLVAEHQLAKQTLVTDNFSHLLIATNSGQNTDTSLHVYIEGDGTPWLRRDAIAADPTPRNPLALKLMLQDPAPSIYLGRPCYFGLMDSPQCIPPIWTHRRYSEEVIDSMQAALNLYLRERPYQQLSFFGYSGGGVIAMLLAERYPQTQTLVTVAANLDIDAWTQLHQFSRLTGSLNPAQRPPLPASIKQTHYVGKRDANVPLTIVSQVSRRQTNSSVRVMDNFDHVCCWEKEWTLILKNI